MAATSRTRPENSEERMKINIVGTGPATLQLLPERDSEDQLRYQRKGFATWHDAVAFGQAWLQKHGKPFTGFYRKPFDYS
jgi:hypothetical protein